MGVGHDSLRINHRKPGHLRRFLLFFVDPVRGQAESGVDGGSADQRGGDSTGIDSQVHSGEGFAFAHDHTAQRDAVAAGFELQVVTHMNGRGQKTHFLCKLAGARL